MTTGKGKRGRTKIVREAKQKRSQLRLDQALNILKEDCGWGSSTRSPDVAGLPADYRFVALRTDGRRMRSNKIVTLYTSPSQKVDTNTVQQLLREVSKRLVMRDSFTMKLIDNFGERVNGNKIIDDLNTDYHVSQYGKRIEREIEKFKDSIEGPLWENFAEYEEDDEEEFLYIFSRSWARALLRKLGRAQFRKILREEGIW